MIWALNEGVGHCQKPKEMFLSIHSHFLGEASVVKECYFRHWCYLAGTISLIRWNGALTDLQL